MKSAYRRQLFFGMIADMKNMEQHYSVMAEKGWMIDKIGWFTHRYRSAEPCKKRFFIDLLPQITMFDYPENEDAQSYRRLCEESGWSFAAASKQLQIFSAADDAPDPVPIHTDNAIQARIYRKLSRKHELFFYAYVFILICFTLSLFLFDDGIKIALSDFSFFYTLGAMAYFICVIWTFCFLIVWHFRLMKSEKQGLPLPIVSYPLSRIRCWLHAAGLIILVAFTVIGAALGRIRGAVPIASLLFAIALIIVSLGTGLWIRHQIYTKRRTREVNRRLFITALTIITVLAFAITGAFARNAFSAVHSSDTIDVRPVLTLSDIGVAEPPANVFSRVSGSILVPENYSHEEFGNQGHTRTHAYRSISSSVASRLYNRFAAEFEDLHLKFTSESANIDHLSDSNAAFWGAQRGLALHSDNGDHIELLLQSGKSILVISLTAHQDNTIDIDSIAATVRKLW